MGCYVAASHPSFGMDRRLRVSHTGPFVDSRLDGCVSAAVYRVSYNRGVCLFVCCFCATRFLADRRARRFKVPGWA